MTMLPNSVLIIGSNLLADQLNGLCANVVQVVNCADPSQANSSQLIDLAQMSDVIVLTTELSQAQKIVKIISPYVMPHAILCDTAPAKQQAWERLAPLLNQSARYLPITLMHAGSKNTALITPSDKSDLKAIERLSALLEAINYRIEIVTPARHDQLMILIDQVPQTLSCALFDSLAEADNDEEGLKEDVLRLCRATSGIYHDQLDSLPTATKFLSQKDQLADALDETIHKLTALRKAIKRGDEAYIQQVIDGASQAYKALKTYSS